jgi:hypothetical protein
LSKKIPLTLTLSLQGREKREIMSNVLERENFGGILRQAQDERRIKLKVENQKPKVQAKS